MSILTEGAVRKDQPKAKSFSFFDSRIYLLVMPTGKKFLRWGFLNSKGSGKLSPSGNREQRAGLNLQKGAKSANI